MTSGPWTIYARQLFPLSYGHPLWGPEPCLTFGEVHLGDVSYLKDGHFCLLFNATRSADDPVNSLRGVPDGFQVLDLPEHMIRRRPNEITQPLLHSKSLQATSIATSVSLSESGATASTSLQYHCQAEEGALLMLKKPAHRTYLNCDLHVRRYIRENMSSWCVFANDKLEIGLEEKDIIFVSGYTKTPVWAEAAFSHSSASGELVIAGGVPSASGEFRVSMLRAVDSSVFSRTGPLDRASMWEKDSEPSETYDQCIFLNYYKMKSRAWWRSTVIRAAAGDHVFRYEGDDDSTSRAGSCSSSDEEDIQDEVEEAYDPVDSLLNYILKHSEVDVACACDADLSSLFKDETLPEDLEGALEALSPSIILDEDGVGMVVPTSQNASMGDPLRTSHLVTGGTSTLAIRRGITPSLPSIVPPPPAASGSSSVHEYPSLFSPVQEDWLLPYECVSVAPTDFRGIANVFLLPEVLQGIDLNGIGSYHQQQPSFRHSPRSLREASDAGSNITPALGLLAAQRVPSPPNLPRSANPPVLSHPTDHGSHFHVWYYPSYSHPQENTGATSMELSTGWQEWVGRKRPPIHPSERVSRKSRTTFRPSSSSWSPTTAARIASWGNTNTNRTTLWADTEATWTLPPPIEPRNPSHIPEPSSPYTDSTTPTFSLGPKREPMVSPMAGVIYSVGTLSGTWGGSMLVPHPSSSMWGHPLDDHTQRETRIQFLSLIPEASASGLAHKDSRGKTSIRLESPGSPVLTRPLPTLLIERRHLNKQQQLKGQAQTVTRLSVPRLSIQTLGEDTAILPPITLEIVRRDSVLTVRTVPGSAHDKQRATCGVSPQAEGVLGALKPPSCEGGGEARDVEGLGRDSQGACCDVADGTVYPV